jgi:two-component system sensor histidine kinase PilS (NtrC family)
MNLRARLSTLIAMRLVASTALLGSAVLVELRGSGAYPVNPYFFLIGVTYALSIVYVATLRLAERHPWWTDVQCAIDAALVTAFIGVTGGITSYFSSLYGLPIIAASLIRFRAGAMRVACVAALCYATLVWAQYAEVPGAMASAWGWTEPDTLPTVRLAGYTLAIHLFGLFAVAGLAGALAEGSRSAGASLERASLAIADLREFNELVVNSLLSGIATADDCGRVLSFNRAASAITALEPEQVVGQQLSEVLQLSKASQEEIGALARMTSMRAEVPFRRHDGERIELGVTATPLAFPDGREGTLVTFQDVTEVRRLERQARLQQRLAAVGEMAAGIAHEIRNPLASMSGSIQVLRQELSLSDEQAQLMDIVVRESDRLNDTIRSFLSYAKPQRFAVTRLDVAAIVRDVGLLLRNGTDVGPDHTVDVRTPGTEIWCEADDTQIRQVLWNLATNGLRAMPRGGTLTLSASTGPGRVVVLSVEDQGRGMESDQIERLFQPFTSSFERGTGLGLAIVHRIVQDYGGSVQVASKPGAGSVFRVLLPQRPASTAAARDSLGVAV